MTKTQFGSRSILSKPIEFLSGWDCAMPRAWKRTRSVDPIVTLKHLSDLSADKPGLLRRIGIQSFASALLFAAQASTAASWEEIAESYSTSDEALQACIRFAESYNYSGGSCSHAGYSPLWFAGWLLTNPGVPQGADQEVWAMGVFYHDLAPPKNLGEPETCVGNPIDAGSGNKFHSEILYSGAGINPVGFSLSYNSGTRIQNGNFGLNWRSAYNRNIVLTSSNGTNAVSAFRPNGKVLSFTLGAGGSWIADLDNADVLVQNKNELGTTSGWSYTTSEGETETYDATGRLLSIVNRAGFVQTLIQSDGTNGANGGYIVDSSGSLTTAVVPVGLLLRVTDFSGRTLTFHYDSLNRAVKMVDPSGAIYKFGYDVTGNLASITYPDSSMKTFLYENGNLSNALTGIIDQNGHRFATWSYDTRGRAISSEHGSGGIDRTALAYTIDVNSGHPVATTVTDALGSVRTYNFNTVLGVNKGAGQTQPGGSGCGPASVSVTYDINGNVKTRTDFNGVTTWFDYDMARNVEVTRIEAQGSPEERTITSTWHPTFRLPATITEPGRITEFIYDNATGNLLSKTLRDIATNKTRAWTYVYTTVADNTLPNQLKTVNGPRTDVTNVTTYQYYTNGDLRKFTNALGHATEITSYDGNGRATGITDPNGIVTTVTYFPRGWLHTSNVAGEITTYEYDGVGQVTRITSPSGAVVRFVYDAAHRLTDIYDAQENHIHYTLDNMGNRVTEEVFNSASQLITTKRREFDALNRLWHDIGALNQTTTYAYDTVGNLTSVDGPLASNTDETKFEYDALNRRTTAIGALLGVTRFSFDALDQLTRVTDPRNLVTQYTVNALGDVTKLESPDTAVTDKTYDEAGNVKTSTNARGIVATYTYDALNRVTRISYSSNGGTIDFTYDVGLHALGKLTSMTDSSGTTQWTYNSKGRVASRVQTVSGQSGTLTTQYGYDNGGNLALITYPSGKVLTYGYLDGRIDSVLLDNAPIMTSVTYQPFGPVKGWTWSNGVQYSRLFDSDGRIYSYPFGDSARVLSYDDASRIRSATDSASAQTFSYDVLDRLTDWVAPYNQQTYNYDATGNRTLLGTGSNQYGYTVDATSNRLASVAGPTSRNYIYDEVGNINYDGSRTFGFDSRNNISSSYTTDGTTTYQLNGWNQRVRKSGPTIKTGATVFAYDEQGHLIGEYDSTGKMIEETIYLGDLPVAVSR